LMRPFCRSGRRTRHGTRRTLRSTSDEPFRGASRSIRPGAADRPTSRPRRSSFASITVCYDWTWTRRDKDKFRSTPQPRLPSCTCAPPPTNACAWNRPSSLGQPPRVAGREGRRAYQFAHQGPHHCVQALSCPSRRQPKSLSQR
jgi:hypothetical protein